jgi:hypothetical protein
MVSTVIVMFDDGGDLLCCRSWAAVAVPRSRHSNTRLWMIENEQALCHIQQLNHPARS